MEAVPQPGLRQRLAALADGVIFDGRNLYDPDEVEAAGLAYYGIGRGRSIRTERHHEQPMMRTPVRTRLIELETRLAFQEQALAELSDALAARARRGRAQRAVAAAGARRPQAAAHALSTDPLTGDAANEPPPPHY